MATNFNATALANGTSNLLARTKQVAQAAGGYLGFGSISPSEQKVLDQLAAAFDK